MNDNKSASNLLARIEKDFFKGVDLAAASRLEGDEHRAFRLSQVERLLTEMHGYAPLGSWLSDEFWTADEGRKLHSKSNPLLSLQEQPTCSAGVRPSRPTTDCLRRLPSTT